MDFRITTRKTNLVLRNNYGFIKAIGKKRETTCAKITEKDYNGRVLVNPVCAKRSLLRIFCLNVVAVKMQI